MIASANPFVLLRRILTTALFISFIAYGAAWWLIPPVQKLKKTSFHEELYKAPYQELLHEKQVPFSYKGKKYLLVPRAHYSISGLVVSHNSVGSITDAYHSSDAVDLKDLCLIWGSNLSSEVYRELTFWSEPWSCHVQPTTRKADTLFTPEDLSNNHLLASTAQIARQIEQVHLGDQVTLEGVLVDYCPDGYPEFLRKTSLTRTDRGNGACEILFVKDLIFLSKHAEVLYRIKEVGLQLAIVVLVLKIISLFVFPYLEFRSGW